MAKQRIVERPGTEVLKEMFDRVRKAENPRAESYHAVKIVSYICEYYEKHITALTDKLNVMPNIDMVLAEVVSMKALLIEDKYQKPINKCSDRNDFLEELALLCEKYTAGFGYSHDDEGVEISLSGKEIFRGFIFEDEAPELLRDAKDKAYIKECLHNVKTEPIFENHPQCDIVAKCCECGAKKNANGEWDA